MSAKSVHLPAKKVIVEDDTYRTDTVHVVTPEMREALVLRGTPIPTGMRVFAARDKQGKRIQETVAVQHIYSGAVLTQAIKRASRWIRNRPATERPPRHIELAMAAFVKADRKAFEALTREHWVPA